MFDRQAYFARRTISGAAISTVMGSIPFLLAYHGQADVPVWGIGGLVVDCLPQGFMVGLMSVWPTTLSARRDLARGTAVAARARFTKLLPEALLWRALALAVISMLFLTLAAAALAVAFDPLSMPFEIAWGLKAMASFGLSVVVTPVALAIALDGGR